MGPSGPSSTTSPEQDVHIADLGLHVSVDDGIADLTLDRRPLNALDMALLHALADAVDDLGSQRDLRLIVLRGNGKAFSAGVDVGEHLGDDLAPMLEAFRRAAMRLLASEVLTLAVAHDAVLGGACELVTLADLAIVADDATLGCPEIRLGVVPPVAAAYFPRLVGLQRAAALILTGDTVSGAEAARLGLVWKSVPSDRLEAESQAVVERPETTCSLLLAPGKCGDERALPGVAVPSSEQLAVPSSEQLEGLRTEPTHVGGVLASAGTIDPSASARRKDVM